MRCSSRSPMRRGRRRAPFVASAPGPGSGSGSSGAGPTSRAPPGRARRTREGGSIRPGDRSRPSSTFPASLSGYRGSPHLACSASSPDTAFQRGCPHHLPPRNRSSRRSAPWARWRLSSGASSTRSTAATSASWTASSPASRSSSGTPTDAPGERLTLAAASDRPSLVPYFAARHALGERLTLRSFRFNGNTGIQRTRPYGNFEYGLTRSVEDLEPTPYYGKGAALCYRTRSDLIFVWAMGRQFR